MDVVRRPGVARLLPGARLARVVVRGLGAGGAPGPASVTVVLTDDAELAELNAAHLGKAGPTDVLSFPMLPPEAFPAHAGQAGTGMPPEAGHARASHALEALRFPPPPRGRVHIGDIAISVERAIEQAEAGRGGQTGDVRWSSADELRLLALHGTLHLCGWDHAEPVEEAAMRALERQLLAEDRG